MTTAPERGSVGSKQRPQATFQVVTSGAQTADTDSNNEAIITGPDHSTSPSQGNLAIISNTAAAVGKGGSLVFAGMYTGSNVAAFAKIAGVQASAYTGVLKFYTRRADATMTESGQFDSVGNFGVGVAPVCAGDFNGPVRVNAYTVATLPAASLGIGMIACVTDANATTRLSVVAGGGSNKAPVWSDGTNWLIV